MPSRNGRRRIELPLDPTPGETAQQEFAALVMLYEAYCAWKDSMVKRLGEKGMQAFLRNRAERWGQPVQGWDKGLVADILRLGGALMGPPQAARYLHMYHRGLCGFSEKGIERHIQRLQPNRHRKKRQQSRPTTKSD
jgi:hypothetical protein